ncbi:uncharacterized protein LOC113339516 [Papaver somniferum]|uniref:uncharacterized protein LOC113339516 n=1 Tax=Papaver somniferum TaxID=3469 RepID=UPI000E701E92|nr:uncharacterized protein LOC113339516 [Papaver somniferum]
MIKHTSVDKQICQKSNSLKTSPSTPSGMKICRQKEVLLVTAQLIIHIGAITIIIASIKVTSEAFREVLFSPLLQGDNYGAWVRGITKALNAKGKLGFVDGSLPPPEDDLTHRCWKRCDDLVGSWLLNSVHPDIRASCLYAASSHAIWKDFQVRLCISNAPILFRLKSSIASIRKESMPASLYYTKIKTLWDQYDSLVASTEACICGAGKHMIERLERDRAMEFLQGLHERFSNLRSQILIMEPFPTALRIFNLVQQEEEQQHITASPLPVVDSAALNTSRHLPSSRPPASHNKRPRPHCDYCNRHEHVREKCYRLHGFQLQTTLCQLLLLLLQQCRVKLRPFNRRFQVFR